MKSASAPASPPLRYVITITSQEDLGSRGPMVRRLGQRVRQSRSDASAAWIGDAARTRIKRQEVLKRLSYNPPAVPLGPQLLQEELLPHARRRVYRLQINPDDQTEAILLLPRHASPRRPVPVLIGIHEHGGMFLLGKEKVFESPHLAGVFRRYQAKCYGEQLPGDFFAAHGFAVLSIDQIGFGSRAIWHEEDGPYRDLRRVPAAAELKIRLRMRHEQFWLHRALLAYGTSEAAMAIHDHRRSIDFLQSLPEIDPQRIGAFGLSVGSMQCHHLAALDERIKASVRVCWSGDWAAMLEQDGPRGLAVHFLLPELDGELHVPEWVALSAPNPVLILNARRDPLYPFAAQEKARQEIQRIARRQRRDDRLRWRYFAGGHCFHPQQQQQALAFFQEFLAAGVDESSEGATK